MRNPLKSFSPTTEPLRLAAAVSSVYALVAAVVDAIADHSAPPESAFVAAVVAIGAVLVRKKVTPIANPKNGEGEKLVPIGSIRAMAHATPNPTRKTAKKKTPAKRR